MTIVEFLRARLDEDEWLAKGAARVTKQESWTPVGLQSNLDARVDDHIAHHDPARVLAEVDAKRRIIDEYERALDRRRAHPDDLASAGALLALHGVCNLLALPYEDHPDYDEAWLPTSEAAASPTPA